MSRACLLLLMFTASACTLVDWDQNVAWDRDPDDRIVLINDSGEPIFFQALELQFSHRVDPIPSFDPAASPFPKVEAGEAVEVENVDQYSPGDDIRFFIYALRQIEGGDATRAVLSDILTVTDEELRQSEGRIAVGKL